MSHGTQQYLGPRGSNKTLAILLTGVGIGWLIGSHLKAQKEEQSRKRILARREAPQRMVAVHLGTQQGRANRSRHRPDTVGEATHLGTGEGWRGYVYPGV